MNKKEIFKKVEEFYKTQSTPSIGQVKNWVNSVTTRVEGVPSFKPEFLVEGDVIFSQKISHPVLLVKSLSEEGLFLGVMLSTSADGLSMDVLNTRFGKQYITGTTLVEVDVDFFMYSIEESELTDLQRRLPNYFKA